MALNFCGNSNSLYRGPDKLYDKLLQINILRSFNFYYNITHKKNKELITFKLRGSIPETYKRSPSSRIAGNNPPLLIFLMLKAPASTTTLWWIVAVDWSLIRIYLTNAMIETIFKSMFELYVRKKHGSMKFLSRLWSCFHCRGVGNRTFLYRYRIWRLRIDVYFVQPKSVGFARAPSVWSSALVQLKVCYAYFNDGNYNWHNYREFLWSLNDALLVT